MLLRPSPDTARFTAPLRTVYVRSPQCQRPHSTLESQRKESRRPEVPAQPESTNRKERQMESTRNRPRSRSLAIALGGTLLLTAMTFGAGAAAQPAEGHPGHIHAGSCAQLGGVVYPLSDVGPGATKDGTPEAAGQAVGYTKDIYPVEMSVTTVDAPLSAIADGNHAINVHESAAKIQNYIACGNIGGTMYGNELVIGLEELNHSGYTGVAVLNSEGNKTTVTVYLAKGLAGA
jgi:hypothetical protein